MKRDTITAIATAPGRGGIGVIRVSGPRVKEIAKATLGYLPLPRQAKYGGFYDTAGHLLDEGIALYFPGPNSFTGEDVLELQGHGGPVILDLILEHTLKLGARMAKPGEFSERAFLNDKLDLAQAEAIADLIEATSTQAAKQALNSLKGEFSRTIEKLVNELIHLRMYVEAAIDFPEEEIDFLSDTKITDGLTNILKRLEEVYHTAQQGAIIREGMKVVIAGQPNAGKSSLLNALSDRDIAIVTDIAGTTRDVLREHIHIDGMPLHIVDTAGIRDNPDTVEKIGIERAWNEIEAADQVLLIIDLTQNDQLPPKQQWPEFYNNPKLAQKVTVVYNKLDQLAPQYNKQDEHAIYLSAKTGEGLTELKNHLKQLMGLESTLEGGFSARRRHLDALNKAQEALLSGQTQLTDFAAGELLAEDLRLAQDHLSEITGAFTPDDLLGKIFSSFCIGK